MTIKTTTIAAGILLAFGAALPVFALDVSVDGTADINGGSAGASAGASVKAHGRTGLSAQADGATTGAHASANLATRIEKAKDRAKEEIARRVAALGDLGDKVGGMAKVTADVKTSISGTVQTQVSALSALQAKIEADTDIDTLKTDIKSITQSYRIFMLVLPQGRITTAADHVQVTAETLAALAGKLSTRITEAQGTGKDVTAATALLTDMNAKIASAKAQADAAVSLTASLKPDNGDKAAMDANKAALKDAQAKLKIAREDLKAARKDAGDIVKALRGMRTDATATASTSVGTQ